MSGPYNNYGTYDPGQGQGQGQPGGYPQYGGMQGYTPSYADQQPMPQGPPPSYAAQGASYPAQGGFQMPPQQEGYQPNAYANQGYGQPVDYGSAYGMGAPMQSQGYHPQGAPADSAFAIPGLNAPALNPLGMLQAGSSLLSGGGNWGTQYMQRVQQRMGWLSGGALNYHFAISNQYVMSKLLILLVPYLKKWTFTRQNEQIQGGQKYRPPRVDVNAPDLYIPLVSAWAYVMLLCGNALLLGKYKPDIVYSKVWNTGCTWFLHSGTAWILIRMMGIPTSLPWGELVSYSGYVFVPACCTLVMGMAGGKWAWWATWMYGSLTSAVFLVRTIKRVLFQEARSYGPNLTLTNYLLLALAAMQFPLLLWLCSVQLPEWALTHHAPLASPLLSPSPMTVKSSPMGSPVMGAAKMMPSPVRV